jgi:hypothetical protein
MLKLSLTWHLQQFTHHSEIHVWYIYIHTYGICYCVSIRKAENLNSNFWSEGCKKCGNFDLNNVLSLVEDCFNTGVDSDCPPNYFFAHGVGGKDLKNVWINNGITTPFILTTSWRRMGGWGQSKFPCTHKDHTRRPWERNFSMRPLYVRWVAIRTSLVEHKDQYGHFKRVGESLLLLDIEIRLSEL